MAIQPRYLHFAVKILGIALLLLILVWVRAFYGAREAYHQGEKYLQSQQFIRAITYFDRSIQWYTPLNTYVYQSAAKLWEIGNHAEKIGDTKLALIAFRAVRRGFYSVNHFIQPGKNWIERCNLKISALLKKESEERTFKKGTARTKKPAFNNPKTAPPNVFWSVLLEIGLLGWIGSTFGLIFAAFGRKRHFRPFSPSTAGWIALCIIFLGMWIMGMMLA